MKNNPIRILHVLGGLNAGGAETFVMNLYRNIDYKLFQFDFVIHSDEVGFYENEILKYGGKIYRVPKYRGYNHFQYLKSWKNILEQHKEYKIIHCHVRSTATFVLKIAKKYGLMTISHSHSTSNGKGITAIIKNIFQKKISKYSDIMLACSMDAARWLYGEKKLKEVKILYNGIDISKYKFSNNTRNKIRKKYGIANDCIVLGHVGRFVSVKNHDFLLELIDSLSKESQKYKLMLVGDGQLKNKIINDVNLKHLSNYVIFVDANSFVHEFYSAFDIFLFPSKYEGLGIVLIEAQISGLKCIISNAIPEEAIISKNVERQPFIKEIWIDRIEKVLSQKNDRENCKLTKSYEKYDIRNTCNELCNMYVGLLKKGSENI